MKKWSKIGIVVILIFCTTGVISFKVFSKKDTLLKTTENAKNLPMLVDLGASTCIPCKEMVPVLEEVKKLYEGKAVVKFIDVYESEEDVEKYDIRVIPTQVFIDTDGKEVFKHEGFFSKEEIIKEFDKMGVK